MSDLSCLHAHGLAKRRPGIDLGICRDCGEIAVWCAACGAHGWQPLRCGICDACWMLIRRPNHRIVAENRRLSQENALLWTLAATLLNIP